MARQFIRKMALGLPPLRRLYEHRNALVKECKELRERLWGYFGGDEAGSSLLDGSTYLIQSPSGPCRIPSWITIGFLSTMPRSGTWYTFYFFEFLFSRLEGHRQRKASPDFEVYPSGTIAKAHMHSFCPGFDESYFGSYRALWDQYKFHTEGFAKHAYATGFVEKNISVFSPQQNPDVRIVYIYRNPLDQIVSHYEHIKRNRARKDFPEAVSASEYMRKGAIQAYIKQYFTFVAMKAMYPDNVMCVKYEDLVKSPSEIFENILGFWNFILTTARRREAFNWALSQSSAGNLQELEKTGQAFGKDLLGGNNSHIRGGETGKWRAHFAQEDLQFAEAEMGKFGLSLADFPECNLTQ